MIFVAVVAFMSVRNRDVLTPAAAGIADAEESIEARVAAGSDDA